MLIFYKKSAKMAFFSRKLHKKMEDYDACEVKRFSREDMFMVILQVARNHAELVQVYRESTPIELLTCYYLFCKKLFFSHLFDFLDFGCCFFTKKVQKWFFFSKIAHKNGGL